MPTIKRTFKRWVCGEIEQVDFDINNAIQDNTAPTKKVAVENYRWWGDPVPKTLARATITVIVEWPEKKKGRKKK